jgi:glycosyltransferase involved in cell wall biosynthesis/O-antigen ligase
VFVGLTIQRPLRLVGALIVVAAPLANATASAGPTRVSLLVPLLLVGLALMAVGDPAVGRTPALRWVGLLAIPLLAIPIADGSAAHGFEVSLVTLLAVAWVTAAAAADGPGLRVVCAAIALQALIQGGIAIWEAKTGHTLNLYSSAGTTQYGSSYSYVYGGVQRPTGTFNDPIGLANGLAITVPVTIALCFGARRWSLKILCVVAAGAACVGLAFALDRAAWIGVFFGMIAFMAVLPAPTRRRVAPWVTGGLAVLIILGIALEGTAVTSKFTSIFHPTRMQGQTLEERGVAAGESDRLLYWHIAFDDGFLAHPFAGVGVDDMSKLILAHSNDSGLGVKAGTGRFANASSTYLQLIGEAGVFALVLFVLLFGGLIADLRAAVRANPLLGAGLLGSVFALLICWVTDVVVTSTPVAACVGVLLGAVAGLGRFSSVPVVADLPAIYRPPLVSLNRAIRSATSPSLAASSSGALSPAMADRSSANIVVTESPVDISSLASARQPKALLRGRSGGDRTEVLMVTNAIMPDQLGGLQRYVRELSGALVTLGAAVTVVTKQVSPELPLNETLPDGVGVIRVRVPDRGRALYAVSYPLASLVGVIRETRQAPGLVHVHYPLQGLAAALSGCGYIHTFHAPVYREVLPERRYALPGALHGGLVGGTRLVERAVARSAAQSIVLTEYTRRELARLAPAAAARAHLIPAGLNSDRFAPGAPIRHPAAEGDGPLIFTARRLVPRTGVTELVAAMPAIVARLPTARLVIAGDGQLRHEIERRVDALGMRGHIWLVGRVSDESLVGWYRAASLFVLPTQELEGFGMSTIEALACGTPAVGTPAGGTPEVLGGLDHGLIAAGTSPDALAAVVLRTVGDPDRLARLAAKARGYVVPAMSWSTIAERHLEIYERARHG